MADSQYSLAEVAKIIGKSEKTISRWIKSGKLPAIRHGTGYLIDEADIPLKIDASIDRHAYIQQCLLGQNGSGESTVNLGNPRRVDMHNLIDMASLLTAGQVDRSPSVENINMMLQKHQAEVEKIIREQNELAEKYARATYKIGQLEERNRMLEEQNVKMEQKVSLLPAPEQWNSTRQELEQTRQKLSDEDRKAQARIHELEVQLQHYKDSQQKLESEKELLKTEHQELAESHLQVKTELETERKKGFWQRLFGT